jgi:hypothetical protein
MQQNYNRRTKLKLSISLLHPTVVFLDAKVTTVLYLSVWHTKPCKP